MNKATIHGFLAANISPDAAVYTDESGVHKGIPNEHETINHSVGEYIRGHIHTNSIETMWAMLKRAHKGTFHKMSPKHLDRYVQEFAGKSNIRRSDTAVQMARTAASLAGRRLLWNNLIADNGLPSGARK